MTTTDFIGLLILIGFTVPTLIHACQIRIWAWSHNSSELTDRIMTMVALLLLAVLWLLVALFQ